MHTALRVKPLEWRAEPGISEMEIAREPFGDAAYGVGISAQNARLFGLFRGYEFLGDYPDRSSAKAAAQADYERRVLSVVEFRPAFPALVEALKAAKVVINMMERPNGMGDEVNAALDARLAKIDAALSAASTDGGQ